MSDPWDNIVPLPDDHRILNEPLTVFTLGSPGSGRISLADMAGDAPPDMVEIPLVDEDVD